MEKSCLPDMPEPLEENLAYSLLLESMRIEYDRIDDGVFSPKIIEPFGLLLITAILGLFYFSKTIGDVEKTVFFLSLFPLALFAGYILKGDILTLRQAQLAKLLREINPYILQNICKNRFKELKEEINYSVFYRLESKDIFEHLQALAQSLKWRHRLILWALRYLVLIIEVFFLSRKFLNNFEIWVVIGLTALCLTHIYVLNRLGRSSAFLKKILNFYNKKLRIW